MLLFQLLNQLITNPIEFVITIIILIVPLFISVTFHEWAHGYVAYKFGDMTPKLQGRLTLNPFAHLDPLGTLMLFTIGIGWAKPVLINPLNFPDKTKQMLVALAGPGVNILLAVIFSFVLVYLQTLQSNSIIDVLTAAITILVRINLILAIFNLLPVPPLDGSKVLAWMLPEKIAHQYLALERYGLTLMLIILFTVGFRFISISAGFIQYKLLEFIKVLI